MPAKHRPDLQVLRRDPVKHGSGEPFHAIKGAYLWPHVNQEDLSGPRNLLLVLNARGRNHPRAFADTDWDSTRLAKWTWNTIPVVLKGYTMMLKSNANDGKPSAYGKLVSWRDWDGARELHATGREFPVGDGLLVIEVQDRLMRFLADVSRSLMHDIPARMLLTDMSYVQPKPHLRKAKEADGYETLVTAVAEEPYCAPRKLNFRRIEAIIKARLDTAENHLLALREDPSYFYESIMTEKDHGREMIADLHRRTTPDTPSQSGRPILGQFIHQLLARGLR